MARGVRFSDGPSMNAHGKEEVINLAIRIEDLEIVGEESEDELTARPPDSAHPATDGLAGFQRWNSVSIDSVLSPAEGPTPATEDVMRVGPMTPNGYDDISPITRGEWGFLSGRRLE